MLHHSSISFQYPYQTGYEHIIFNDIRIVIDYILLPFIATIKVPAEANIQWIHENQSHAEDGLFLLEQNWIILWRLNKLLQSHAENRAQ